MTSSFACFTYLYSLLAAECSVQVLRLFIMSDDVNGSCIIYQWL